MLAHELRNPMAPIRNVADILSRNPQDGQRPAITEILRRQVSVLSRLVDDLLDVSRITQGRIELKRRPVQISEVIAQAVETVQPLLSERRQRISVMSHGTLRLNGDLTRLVQCVVNLLSNAAKYTQPEGEIRVESSVDQGEAVLTVTDNGAGITAELLPYVFDLFVQGDRTLDRARAGSGSACPSSSASSRCTAVASQPPAPGAAAVPPSRSACRWRARARKRRGRPSRCGHYGSGSSSSMTIRMRRTPSA